MKVVDPGDGLSETGRRGGEGDDLCHEDRGVKETFGGLKGVVDLFSVDQER
jgi:hypothetical protein